jgi:serine/threonine protein kinase
LLIKNQKC